MVTSSLTADPVRPSSTVSSFVVSTVYSVTEDGGYQTVCDGLSSSDQVVAVDHIEHLIYFVESGSLPVIVGAIVGGAVLLLIVAGIGIVRQRR